MSFTGGDIISASFNHPTLGSGQIFGKANEDSTFDTGGFVSEDDMSMIAGSGEMIDKVNRKRWCVEIVAAWDMNDKQTLETAVSLASSLVPATWVITHINGSVYKGLGKPVGDLQGAGNQATFPLKLSGGGILKKII